MTGIDDVWLNWRWTDERLDKLADILIGLGHVMVASIVVPFFFDTFAPILGVLGLSFAIAF